MDILDDMGVSKCRVSVQIIFENNKKKKSPYLGPHM